MRFNIIAHVLWNRHVYIRSQHSGTDVPVWFIDSMNKYIKGPYSTLSSSLKRGAHSIPCIYYGTNPPNTDPFMASKGCEIFFLFKTMVLNILGYSKNENSSNIVSSK